MAGHKKLYLFLVAALALQLPPARAQEEGISLEDLGDAVAAISSEYLAPEFLDALEKGDRQVVERFLHQLSDDLGSDQVLDLAELEDAARTAANILAKYEETQAYAAWLRARLDYFSVAEKLKSIQSPGPRGQTPVVPTPPSAQKQREVWSEEIKKEPAPRRAQSYVKDFKRVFREQKVPAELVWIAEVESSFDARACSPVGAAGMFQLMPATAKRFGLSRFPFDQRYQPVPSATAAAKYLGFLKSKFKDWRLAIAAYNAGEGTVGRLLEAQKETTYDAIAAKLPAQTQMYVPKVEAVILRREGVKLTQLEIGPVGNRKPAGS